MSRLSCALRRERRRISRSAASTSGIGTTIPSRLRLTRTVRTLCASSAEWLVAQIDEASQLDPPHRFDSAR